MMTRLVVAACAALRSKSVLAAAIVLVVACSGARLDIAAAAAPAQEAATLSVIVTAYADVTGGSDPACPACDGEYGDADEAFALAHPLSSLRFEIRDTEGVVVGEGVTSALGGLQTARLSVPAPSSEGTSYEAVLIETPADWMLCFDDSASHGFDAADAGPDGVRVAWRFYAGCERDLAPEPEPSPTLDVPTALPTDVAPVTPPAPMVTPTTPAPVESPERTDPAPSAAVDAPPAGAPPAPRQRAGLTDTVRDAEGRLGSLRGRAYLDANADGRRDADEIGMADVGVRLHGGGLQLLLITDATGEFGFDALGAGDYELFIAPGAEWRVTTPAHRWARVAGDTQLDLDFGLTPSNEPVAAPGGGGAPVGEALPRLPATGAAARRTASPLAALSAGLALLALLGAAQAARRKEACL